MHVREGLGVRASGTAADGNHTGKREAGTRRLGERIEEWKRQTGGHGRDGMDGREGESKSSPHPHPIPYADKAGPRPWSSVRDPSAGQTERGGRALGGGHASFPPTSVESARGGEGGSWQGPCRGERQRAERSASLCVEGQGHWKGGETEPRLPSRLFPATRLPTPSRRLEPTGSSSSSRSRPSVALFKPPLGSLPLSGRASLPPPPAPAALIPPPAPLASSRPPRGAERDGRWITRGG